MMKQHFMKPILALALLAGSVLVFTTFSHRNLDSTSNSERQANTMSDSGIDWENLNLDDPPLQKLDPSQVVIQTKNVMILGINTFYREALRSPPLKPSGVNVLLLHGMAFSSETWKELDTLQYLALAGHRVIAVDLPGYKNTKGTTNEHSKYLHELIKSLKLNHVVIVSPSMSGTFSIPYIIEHPKEVLGYIPVAPVATSQLAPVASTINIPTLIIYGELDTRLGISSYMDLKNIPTSITRVIPQAKHPAYLDNPDLFHKLVINFIDVIKPQA